MSVEADCIVQVYDLSDAAHRNNRLSSALGITEHD